MKNLIHFILIIGLLLPVGINMEAYAQQSKINIAKEKKAIKKVIEQQTKWMYQKDFEEYQHVWAHKPYAVRMFGGERYQGWEKIGKEYKDYMKENPEPMDYKVWDLSGYSFRIHEKVAWVIHKQGKKGEAPTSYNIRILEKINGTWKIVYHNTVPFTGN